MEKKRLIIIDGNAVIHRAFHALPPLTTKNGEAVGAIYGFLLVFLRAIKEFKPDFIATAFDFPAPCFRHKKYKLYKANRKKAPEELYQQIPKTKDILQNLNIQVFEKEGYEADDIIGTIARNVSRNKALKNIETVIVSGDLDTLQIVDRKTKVYALKKGIKDIALFDEQAVKERYGGLKPNQLSDFKGLRGDPSDNIPGVLGVGEKTAIVLLKEFGSLENLYKELDKNSKKIQKIKQTLRKRLLDFKDKARLSKTLGELKYDVPVEFNIENCRLKDYDKEKVIEILKKYGFKTLISRLSEFQSNAKPRTIPLKREVRGREKKGAGQLKII